MLLAGCSRAGTSSPTNRPCAKMYSTLFASKYTVGVAKTRANLVIQSCKAPTGSGVDNVWVETFQGLLRNVSCERIASEAGEKFIQELSKKRSPRSTNKDSRRGENVP